MEANGRTHGTTGKRPSDVFAEETLHLIKRGLIAIISTPVAQKPIKAPVTVVQKTNLAQYDDLLTGGIE